MATSLTLSQLLFRTKKTFQLVLGQTTNSSCPAGTPCSPKNGAKRHPKFSELALVLDKIILDKSVSAICCDDGKVYCEVFHPSDSSVHSVYYEGGDEVFSSSPSSATDTLCAVFLSSLTALKSADQFTYTFEAANAVADAFDSTYRTVPADKLGYLCDCFYYDLVEAMGGGSASVASPFKVQQFSDKAKATVQRLANDGMLQPIRENRLGAFLQTSFKNVSYISSGTSKKSKAAPFKNTWMEDCINGKYEIGFNWSPEQQEKIRPVDFLDTFVPNSVHAKLTQLIYNDLNEVIDRLNIGAKGLDSIKDNYVNAIICGMPGTGKTTTAEALSATLGLPIYTVANSKYTEEDTFEGMNKVSSGSFIFKSTPFLEGYKNGGIIVLEEFNLADPGVMQGAIGQAIEFPFILMEDGCTEVHRHPLCVIIGTMNTGTQGAREPNEAFTSRLPLTFLMDEVTEDELQAILEKKGFEPAKCKKVVNAYQVIINYLKEIAHSEEMVMCITTRHCIGALKLMSIGLDTKEAIRDTMIGSIAIRDISLAKQVYQDCIVAAPL